MPSAVRTIITNYQWSSRGLGQGSWVNLGSEYRLSVDTRADAAATPADLDLQGLQRQPDNTGKPTIEQELEAGLLEVGALLARNAGALHRVNWSRTSRTDKGVSAAANVIAFDVPHACLRAEQQRGQLHQQHQQERAAGSAAAGSSGNSTAAGGSGAAGGDAELAGLVARLNGALRAPIRVWGGVRVGQSFDARRVACGRRYEYLLPVWALDPAVGKPRGVQQSQQPQPQQPQRQAQDSQPASIPFAPAEPPSNAANGNASATAATTSAAAAGTTTAERSRMRAEAEIGASSFALSPTELKRLNLILGVFVGAHCFHNFTSEPADDPESLRRTIHVARAEGPVYLRPSPETEGAAAATGSDGSPDSGGQRPGGGQGGGQGAGQGQGQGAPYVRIVFIGTGFLMHQIRRMVGLALAVARKAAPPDCIRAALDPARPHITPPTAPPTGLMMDRAYFSKESYDTARAAATAATAAAAPAATAAQATTGLTGSGGGSASASGGGGGGDGDWRRQLEALSLSGEAFKLRELYTAVCGAGPVEMFQFLCGLTDSAFGFRSWSKRPAGSAAATAAAAATGKTAAPTPAAGRGGGAGGAGGGAKTASEAGGAGAGATAAPAALAVAGAESVAGEGEGQPPPLKQPRLG